jgi:hypothetical protein
MLLNRRDFAELLEGVRTSGSGEIVRFFEAFVSEPEDVEA